MKRPGAALLAVVACVLISMSASLPCWAGLTDIGASLPGGYQAAWGDYDNDGDLDLAVPSDSGTRVCRDDNGTFVIAAELAGGLSCAWGDYDNDGDLDLAVGTLPDGPTKVYRNDNGNLVDTRAAVAITWCVSLAWGDCDNDGDLDLALSGDIVNGSFLEDRTKIYRNDRGAFTDSCTITGRKTVAWADYDNDGDLDLSASNMYGSDIFRNDNGTFDNRIHPIPIGRDRYAWGDYDSDGDLDLAIIGTTGSVGSQLTRIYRNDSGVLTDIAAPLTPLFAGDVAWADVDNDGDLDLSACDRYSSGSNCMLYRDDNGVFVGVPLAAVTGNNLAWGDYDNDGDLDLAIVSHCHQYIPKRWAPSSQHTTHITDRIVGVIHVQRSRPNLERRVGCADSDHGPFLQHQDWVDSRRL